jgi:hypothetical protein
MPPTHAAASAAGAASTTASGWLETLTGVGRLSVPCHAMPQASGARLCPGAGRQPRAYVASWLIGPVLWPWVEQPDVPGRQTCHCCKANRLPPWRITLPWPVKAAAPLSLRLARHAPVRTVARPRPRHRGNASDRPPSAAAARRFLTTLGSVSRSTSSTFRWSWLIWADARGVVGLLGKAGLPSRPGEVLTTHHRAARLSRGYSPHSARKPVAEHAQDAQR